LTGTSSSGRVGFLKAIAWSIAFIVLTLVSAGALGFAGALLTIGSPTAAAAWLMAAGPGAMLLQAGVTLASAAFWTWLIGFRVLGLSLRDLRYAGRDRALSGFGFGLLAGALTAAVALLISAVVGGAEWVRDSGTVLDYLSQSSKTVIVLAPAALSEEVVFRGVPLVLLAATMGRGAAVVAVAVLFAFAHLANPNVTALGLGNIAMAGIFLGLAFYAPGGIWTAFGAHLGWNAMLACLDAPVSGLPFRIPLLDYHSGGPAWLTGGAFGPEGGLAATAALTAAILVLYRWARRDVL
jgi:membrane protease YdiL (CAAX protease family)